MCYVSRCFQETTGHHLQGLGLHTKWIRPQSYYHWKVAELDQLQCCPHLRELPVPLGPMEHPSKLQQPQRPNKPGASGHGGMGGRMTLGSSSGPYSMEGGAADGSSWFDQVVHEEARPGASKMKENQCQTAGTWPPFPPQI